MAAELLDSFLEANYFCGDNFKDGEFERSIS